MPDDASLLQVYTQRRDAEAFAELVRRYAGLVYGVCLRLTRNPHDAEDVTQECFLELARRAASVTGPLPGWLHATATTRSLNALRNGSTRRRHEAHAMNTHGSPPEPGWQELAPHVDRALEDLPEELRTPLVLHYLQGLSQTEVAERLNLNQATISRRLERGLDELRERLKKAGVVASLALLAALLTQHGAQAAPPSVLASLGKLALAGVGPAPVAPVVGGTTTGATAGATVAGFSAAKLAVAAGVLLALGGVTFYIASQRGEQMPRVAQQEDSRTPEERPMGEPQKKTDNAAADEMEKALAAGKPADIVFQGDANRQDSFSLTLQAVARAYGVDVDYETVFALSTNGFAPCIHPPENCRMHQREHGRGQCIDLVAQRLGLSLRPLDLSKDPKPWLAIREALGRGETVVTSGGWSDVAYTCWGVILEAPENGPVGAIRGAAPDGKKSHPFDHMRPCWAVSRSKPTLTPEQADLAMLERAVARIRGDKTPFLPGDVVYGLKAMDLWIADMKRPAFQPDDPGSSVGNATRCALYASEGACDTGSYLRRRLAAFPDAARPHLSAAAEQYELIWRTLTPFAAPAGKTEGYAKIMGDPAKQSEHADKVLMNCRDALAKAAEHLESALRAIGENAPVAQVKRDGNRVWIEGVPDGKFGIQWDLFVRAMQTLLAARGVRADYGELLANSGDAFNLCHASHWQGTAYLGAPTDPVANLARAYGFSYGTTHQGPRGALLGRPDERKAKWAAEALERLYAEIDAGRPVLGAGLEAHCGSCTVVVGYDRQAQMFCHVGDGPPYRWTLLRGVAPGSVNADFGLMDGRCRGTVTPNFVGGWQANPLYLIGARTPAPAARQNAAAALRRAVELHRAAKSRVNGWGGVDYFFGAEAYQQWAQALRELDFPPDLKKPQPKDAYDWYSMGNLDTQVDQIVRGREAAAQFCEKAVAVLPAGARTHLLAAAQLYREEIALARETFAAFIPMWDGNDAPRVAWLSSAERRQGGAEAVEKMLEKERAAIKEIELALAAPEGGEAMAEVKREDGKVWIEGVPALGWGKGIENTYAGSLAAALSVTPHPFSYRDIMGFSGLAFRVRWFQGNPGFQRWCPSSPVGEFPEPIMATAKATGWKLRCECLLGQANPDMTRFVPDIVREIDAGRPVTAYDAGLNLGVIVGYEDGGKRLLFSDYGSRGKVYPLEPSKLGAQCHFLEKHDAPPPLREAFVDAVRAAIREWDRKPEGNPGGKGPYQHGKAALYFWAKDLGLANTLTQKDRELLFFVSHWNYGSLADARHQAVSFLRAHAGMFDGEVRRCLERAAGFYEQEGNLLGRAFGAKDAFLGPWSGKKIADWTPEIRAREQAILTEARLYEWAAYWELERALALVEEIPGQVRPDDLVSVAGRRYMTDLPYGAAYLGAGVPYACVQALNFAGTKTDFVEFAAGTGWAFSFGYKYNDISPAFLAVRGSPRDDGPYEVFRFLTEKLGYGNEDAPVRDQEKFWAFVRKHIDAGTPVLSEHLDGGLICGYREKDGKKEVWFDGPVGLGWTAKLQPSWVHVLVKKGEPLAPAELYKEGLVRAVRKASAHDWKGVPQGLAALEAYLKDASDPTKDFAKCEEYFCWATFERLAERKCCAVWLRRAAETLAGEAQTPLLAAAERYDRAWDAYEHFRTEVGAGEPSAGPLRERARTPERIAVLVPILKEGIEEERAGIEEMKRALKALGLGTTEGGF